MRVDNDALYAILAGDEGDLGVFQRVLGFGTGTGVIKGVHVMNDLAQCVLGGAPDHGGDLLCCVIREAKTEGGEDNSDLALRADARVGAAYRRAYPDALGAAAISRLREGAALLLNFDGGMYKPGDRMASGLATHRDLLGFEGFRRFGLGRYLEDIVGEEGRARIAELFNDPCDPLTRALGPLRVEAPLRDTQPRRSVTAPSPLDEAIGRRITTLLSHPLTKTTLLRYVLILATLGVNLKVLGAGRPRGLPCALATTADEVAGPRPGRQEAVQSFARGVAAFYDRVAADLVAHPGASKLERVGKPGKRGVTEVSAKSVEAAAKDIVAAARTGPLKADVYWPEEFGIALGRKVGLILPRRDQAGWGKHLALTTDAVEALVLSGGGPGRRSSWSALWADIREDLGLVVGVNEYEDAQLLASGGVLHVDLDALERNSQAILAQAVRRGVARRLPDSGADAGGELQ